MIVLALDTSSDRGSVALTVGGDVVGEVRLANSVQHSDRLFRSIEFLLESSQIGVEDVNLFAAARGPGSFTGLRVGLAAVEGLAFTSGGKACAISTLGALAWGQGSTSSLIAPVVDARRGELYGALYRRTHDVLEEIRRPRVEDPEDFLASLPSEAIKFCGSGMKLCTALSGRHSGWEIRESSYYLARAIAQMAEAGHDEPFEPLYLRPPAAERTARGDGKGPVT